MFAAPFTAGRRSAGQPSAASATLLLDTVIDVFSLASFQFPILVQAPAILTRLQSTQDGHVQLDICEPATCTAVRV